MNQHVHRFIQESDEEQQTLKIRANFNVLVISLNHLFVELIG